MQRSQKEAVIQDMSARLGRAKGAVLVDFRGLTVKESTELRHRLQEKGGQMRVIKNRLLGRAAASQAVTGLEPFLEGPTAIVLTEEDPAVVAKVVADFAKDHKNLTVKAGILNARVISSKDVAVLASLPAREVLVAQLVGGLQAPLAGLVGVLQGTVRKLVYALDAVRRQKQEQGGGAEAAQA
ncbi:MAG: 50S ribosomal protein L10 [Limnochordaceae bacterium]|nr:50S ribosomal protein L10 [Limnochordaceae bacterium]